MAEKGAFLADLAGGRSWRLPEGSSTAFVSTVTFSGPGVSPLEVAVVSAERQPSATELRSLWKKRHSRAASPLLLIAVYSDESGSRASACGPVGEEPATALHLEKTAVEQIAAAALREPDRHAAIRFLLTALPEASSELPGLRNSGMFASHELRTGVPARADWAEACARAVPLLAQRGRGIVNALGFTIERRSPTTEVLRAKGVARAIAVFLDDAESIDGNSTRFGGTSPITHALAAADADGIPFVLLTRGPQLRLYSTVQTGVGRKGRTETFVEVHLSLLPPSTAGYLALVFSSDALQPGGSFEQILERSRDFSSELGKRLRDRVYEVVVPELAQAVARRTSIRKGIDEKGLNRLYETALVIVYRLLFIAYGEDKDLLPYRTNGLYQRHALKSLARDLAERRNAGPIEFDARATDRWTELQSLFRAVSEGNREWGVPAYGGGLFSNDRAESPVGADIARLELTNSDIGHALVGLLVDKGDDGTYGPVDFRSLSVREFGTIYEGLLESNLSVAGTPLVTDEEGRYVPAKASQVPQIKAGHVYLHNAAGTRKSTGSYFTKPFAVEHLLRQAVDPALEQHLSRLEKLLTTDGESAAATAFFDFRCADLAMGSGHFLIAAVDHIEARLSSFLSAHPIAGVLAELERLRTAAIEGLGSLADGVEIEHSTLLRRQVARRCVYGVDKNVIAVELARLAMWVHTFLPGLPLSYLDHNLVCGDSLVGVATLQEARSTIDPAEEGRPSLFGDVITAWLEPAAEKLRRLARAAEASSAEVRASRRAHEEAREAVSVASDLFDLLVASRLGEAELPVDFRDETIVRHPDLAKAKEVARSLGALHFLISFPEVFQRDRPGFDCIVGNPPWDKLMFEEQQFWVGREPGLNALAEPQRAAAIRRLRKERPAEVEVENREQAERERLQAYSHATFEMQGSVGHLEYAKLFVERAFQLLSAEGRLAYVLPRQSLVLGGWADLRRLLVEGRSVTIAQARNSGGWLFDDLHNSYMVAFTTSAPIGAGPAGAAIWPGVTTIAQLLDADVAGAVVLHADDLKELSDTCVIPWFSSPKDRAIFDAMRSRPTISSAKGWVTGHHDARWDFRGTGPHKRFVSRSATDISWHILMARHVDAYSIDRTMPYQTFIKDPRQLAVLGTGVTSTGKGATLDPSHPAIVFRHPSRNDDSRTLITAVLESSGELHNKGYVHAVSHAKGTSARDLLALLGFMNSFVCDWWVRRFADRHITAPLINRIPLPDWTGEERDTVAAAVAELLRRGGSRSVAGAINLAAYPAIQDERDELLARIDLLSARGFGLNRDAVAQILDDFSSKGCPPSLRQRLIA